MDNKINFTGSFLIKNPPIAARKELKELAGKRHRIIFKNFDNTDDILYIVKDCKNRAFAKFITENNLRFKFFPLINTKSGLDYLYPEKAVAVINAEQQVIEQGNKLLKFLKLDTMKKTFDKNIKGITHALGIKQHELIIRSNNGITYAFYKKNGNHVFKASPTNKYGENYVYFNLGNKSDKYIIHGDKIIFKYPDKAKYFNENFDNAVSSAIY